jgi:periplasmic protein TonB
MVENVTDIIVARRREPEGLKTMLVWSMAGHIGLAAMALLWRGPAAEPPRQVMTISLGGAPGPDTGGKTQIGGQAVQAPPPPEPVKPVEAPPAPTAPVMTLPTPRASRPRPQPKPAQAPPDATANTPNTGSVPREGTTRVRGQGLGTGLSSAGGSGGAVTLDVTDFCCNEYLDQMVVTIRRNWDQSQGLVGSTTMQFIILKNGTIQAPLVEKSSGFAALDNAAIRALQLSRLPPLPAAFENPTLTVHLRFDFQR